MVKRLRTFPKRYVFYAAILVYLFCDLYWLKGPIYRRVEYQRRGDRHVRKEIEEGRWVARVNLWPITRRQLDRATDIYLYRRGDKAENLSESALRITRRAVMQQLVNDTLVRQYSLAERFQPDAKAVEKQIAQFKNQFADEKESKQRMAGQEMTEEELASLMHQQVTEQLWLEKRIRPAVQVDDEEARQWYEKNRKNEEALGFAVPEIIRARHIFISTVEGEEKEKETLIRDVYRQLTEEKKDFIGLAALHSEDERSKSRGGDLGWFSRQRMPEDFAKAVFALPQGETSQPFRTTLGWHIVEVTDRKAPRDLSFEELKPEIVALLKNEKRKGILEVFMLKLRKASNIEIYPQNF